MSNLPNDPKQSRKYDSQVIDMDELKRAEREAEYIRRKKRGKLGRILAFVFFLIVAGAVSQMGITLYEQGYRIKIENIKTTPFPELNSVQAEALAQVASKPWDASKPALIMLQAQDVSNVIYIASNSPNSNQFHLRVDSIDGTLIGSPAPAHIQFDLPVQFSHFFFKSEPITTNAGLPLPKGLYHISLVDESGIPMTEVLGFLGGIRDSLYTQELKNQMAAQASPSPAASASPVPAGSPTPNLPSQPVQGAPHS